MIKKVKRETFPIKLNIFDSNWNRGIMIGNTIIFTGKYRRETKKIKNIYQEGQYTHGFYVKYEKDPVLHIIYTRE